MHLNEASSTLFVLENALLTCSLLAYSNRLQARFGPRVFTNAASTLRRSSGARTTSGFGPAPYRSFSHSNNPSAPQQPFSTSPLPRRHSTLSLLGRCHPPFSLHGRCPAGRLHDPCLAPWIGAELRRVHENRCHHSCPKRQPYSHRHSGHLRRNYDPMSSEAILRERLTVRLDRCRF